MTALSLLILVASCSCAVLAQNVLAPGRSPRQYQTAIRPLPAFVPGRNPPGRPFQPPGGFRPGYTGGQYPVRPGVAVPLPIRVRRQVAVTLPARIPPNFFNPGMQGEITNTPLLGIMPVIQNRPAGGQLRGLGAGAAGLADSVNQGFNNFGGSFQSSFDFPSFQPLRFRRQVSTQPLLGSGFGGDSSSFGGNGGGFVGTADGALSGFAVQQQPFPIVNRPAGGQLRGGGGAQFSSSSFGGDGGGGFAGGSVNSDGFGGATFRTFGGQNVPGERGRFGGNRGRGGSVQFTF